MQVCQSTQPLCILPHPANVYNSATILLLNFSLPTWIVEIFVQLLVVSLILIELPSIGAPVLQPSRQKTGSIGAIGPSATMTEVSTPAVVGIVIPLPVPYELANPAEYVTATAAFDRNIAPRGLTAV